jgi:hypothetical protein
MFLAPIIPSSAPGRRWLPAPRSSSAPIRSSRFSRPRQPLCPTAIPLPSIWLASAATRAPHHAAGPRDDRRRIRGAELSPDPMGRAQLPARRGLALSPWPTARACPPSTSSSPPSAASRETMRCGSFDAVDYTKVADLEGLHSSRPPESGPSKGLRRSLLAAYEARFGHSGSG